MVAKWPPTRIRVQVPLRSLTQRRSLPATARMATESQRPEGNDRSLASLNGAIQALNLAKDISSVTPAKAVFGSASTVLTMIRVRSLL